MSLPRNVCLCFSSRKTCLELLHFCAVTYSSMASWEITPSVSHRNMGWLSRVLCSQMIPCLGKCATFCCCHSLLCCSLNHLLGNLAFFLSSPLGTQATLRIVPLHKYSSWMCANEVSNFLLFTH